MSFVLVPSTEPDPNTRQAERKAGDRLVQWFDQATSARAIRSGRGWYG
ncbi:MAG: hypothetical protein AVDCRST_MAG33-1629 [uncultured Thermomicrobiales bacterium]|uniref:Uncharacterized protein n=1 Tax=uncultured Thermomicrobiales bacterium TaxID=1645740 RepID=A0A6J4UWM9_9BACT|nr:MAG: hypothetical protein AVDCRST_MAG33-1629 [uncultured Thermomicrobiales bacterium]